MEGQELTAFHTGLFVSLYAIWHDWHALGVLPHGKGPLDEKPIVVRWIKRFEGELHALQKWEFERDKEKLPVCRAERRYS